MKRLLDKIIPHAPLSPPARAPSGGGLPRDLAGELTCGVHHRVLAAVRNIEKTGSPATTEAAETIAALMKSGDWEIRSASVEALAALGVPALDSLYALLNAPDADVRCDAAWALGVIGDGAAITPLLNALNDPEPRVQGFIANALGKIRDERGIPPLIELLAAPEPNVRTTAASMLGRMGQPAVRALTDAYGTATAALRPTILWTLGEIARPEARDLLLEALSDADAPTRAAAASAVGRFVAELRNDARREAFLARLTALLRDDSMDARQHAAFALANFGDSEGRRAAFETMVDALDSPQSTARAGAALILGEFGDAQASEPLRRLLLREREQTVRHAAKTALEAIKRRAAVAE